MNWDRIKEKLMSKVVWVTAIPIIASLVAKYCGVDIHDDLMSVIMLLAIFGILNDPNDRGQF